MRVFLRDRRSFRWGWIVTPAAPRMVNDISYVLRTKYASLSAWQAQYLVRLDRDTCCSAHSKWGFICDEDEVCVSFCVTGAAFGGRRSNWWSSSVTGRGRRNIWNVRLGYEEKRKSKSNIVCLCGLQWVCFSRIGHLTLNVSSGRMSLWTAATKKRENLKAILYVFADCNECVFHV